jgi:hypothetical protein
MKELSKAKARRAIRWAHADFEGTRDPRKRGRHEHSALLALLTAAFSTGARTLRAVERFGDEMSGAARRALGLKSGPSDTTLYWLLNKQKAHGFGLLLVRRVKEALVRKWIGNDLFPHGVVAFDGKSVWSGHYPADSACHKSEGTGERADYWLLMQRACLVSSSARPCVAQMTVGGDTGEAPLFAKTFAFLVRHFGRSFEFVTYDAGGTSRENAALVHAAQKAYVFAVKGNQPSVHLAAISRLGSQKTPGDAERMGEAKTDERADGAAILREVFRCVVGADDPEVEFAGAKQLWRVRQTTTRVLPGGTTEATVEDRYFLTNRVLKAELALKIVRLHWGIENGPNWTMDLQLGEDAGVPCETGNGIVITSWLRLLAYNALSIWRSKLQPVRDEIVACWDRSRSTLRDAFRMKEAPEVTPV